MKRKMSLKGVTIVFSFVFLLSCKKNLEPAVVVEAESAEDSEISPAIKNGVLKFPDFRSFRVYDVSKKKDAFRASGSFISMQDAYDDIVRADAEIGEQLAKKHPFGPAALFDNTHTDLLKTFPNSAYVEGDSKAGFYYEINSFDKNITGKINKDGFVLVGEWLVQYSARSLKMWQVGPAGGVESRTTAKMYLSADVNDAASREALNSKWADAVANSSSHTLIGWPPLSSFWKNSSCQNTIRSGGVNKRVLGYVDYKLYGYVASQGYEACITNRSVSLKGRLFGLWYDSWATGHVQQYNSYGPAQTLYLIYPNNINLNFGRLINWTSSDNLAFNNRSENITQYPTNAALGQGNYLVNYPWPETYVTIGAQPALTYYNAKFKIASGYGTASDPTCNCAFSRP